MLKQVRNIILDTLFPIRCLGCRQEKTWLCQKCLDKIPILSEQVCPYCEKVVTSKGECCSNCQRLFRRQKEKPPVDNLLVASHYQDKLLAKIIHLYKYSFVQELSLPLGTILSRAISKHDLTIPDLIIPIPLHQRRLRWRGFNQAEEIAFQINSCLFPAFELKIDTSVAKRRRYTSSQMKIRNYQERKKNLSHAFQVKCPEKISGQNILLIDDVATTGSTLFECARVLKENGAQKVMGAVIARQEFRH